MRVRSTSIIESATSQRGWGFHTLGSGIYRRDHRFRPWIVGIVEVWTRFSSKDKTLSSPGAAAR